MLNVRLAGATCIGNSVHQAIAGDVFDDVVLYCPFVHEMSWMRSGT